MSTESASASAVISSSSSSSSSLKLKTSYISFKLDETNYIQWRRQIVPILRSHDIYNHVDPTVASSPHLPCSANEEPSPNPEYLPWFQVDSHLLSWVQATLTQSVFVDIPDFTSSRELWKYLANTYVAPTAARSLQLRHQLQTLQRENLSISAYLAKITSIRDSLLTSYAPLTDVELVLHTLRGLGPDYQAFSTAIENRSSLHSFFELKPLLLNHEIRLTQYKQPIPDSTPSTTFYGSTLSSSPSTNFSSSRFSNNSSRGYRGGGRGTGGRGRGGYFTPPTYSFGTQSQQQQSILGAPPSQLSSSKQPCKICDSKAHTGLNCTHRFNHAYQARDLPQSFAAMQLQAMPFDQHWYADTGATNHMTK
ncbi:hypothetical protein MKW92_013933 [Papaver armeniacum]|nr:hypothetical protein MKW92_013933 [Papaver armeniacum]